MTLGLHLCWPFPFTCSRSWIWSCSTGHAAAYKTNSAQSPWHLIFKVLYHMSALPRSQSLSSSHLPPWRIHPWAFDGKDLISASSVPWDSGTHYAGLNSGPGLIPWSTLQLLPVPFAGGCHGALSWDPALLLSVSFITNHGLVFWSQIWAPKHPRLTGCRLSRLRLILMGCCPVKCITSSSPS